MHEVSLIADLIDRVDEVAEAQKFDRVLEIRLRVGELCGVEPSCLEFCFPEVTRGTRLEGARLVLESEPAELKCRACGHVSRPSDPGDLTCPRCHSGGVDVSQGREFKVVDLEVV